MTAEKAPDGTGENGGTVSRYDCRRHYEVPDNPIFRASKVHIRRFFGLSMVDEFFFVYREDGPYDHQKRAETIKKAIIAELNALYEKYGQLPTARRNSDGSPTIISITYLDGFGGERQDTTLHGCGMEQGQGESVQQFFEQLAEQMKQLILPNLKKIEENERQLANIRVPENPLEHFKQFLHGSADVPPVTNGTPE